MNPLLRLSPTVHPYTAAFLKNIATNGGAAPSLQRARLYDDLIRGLVNAGLWQALDALYILAAENSATARTNLVSGSFNLTVNGTTTFTANLGYQGDGSTGYLATGYTPSTAGGNMTLNSASIGCYVTSKRYTNANSSMMGCNNAAGTATLDLWAFYTDGKTYAASMDNISGGAGPGLLAATSVSGLWINSRTASANNVLYRNGYLYNTFPGTYTSVALPDRAMTIGAANEGASPSGFSADNICAAFIGGGLTASQVSTLTNLLNTYMVALGVNTFGGATSNYSSLYFCNNVTGLADGTPGAGLLVSGTNDGINFSDALTSAAPVLPPAATITAIGTPTVTYANGGLWMLAQPSVVISGQILKANLYSLSLPGLVATHIQDIDFSGVISGAGAEVWSAQWFQDPADSSWHAFMAASSTATGGTGFQIYETHPTSNTDFTQAWSTPVAISGTSLPNNMIDPCVMKIGSTYYIWYRNITSAFIELLTSSSLLTGYTVAQSGNFAGWGTGLEAPFVFPISGGYEILLDTTPGGTSHGIDYSTCTTANFPGGPWSSKAAITAPFTAQHGMIIPTPPGFSN